MSFNNKDCSNIHEQFTVETTKLYLRNLGFSNFEIQEETLKIVAKLLNNQCIKYDNYHSVKKRSHLPKLRVKEMD